MFNSQNFPPLTGHKRPRIQSPPCTITENYDRFFKISLTEGTFKATSPFLINKCLQAHFGTLKDIRKLADGSLLIETVNEKQSSLANSFKKLHTYEVTTVPHATLNIVKGIITCSDLANCEDDEILSNLSDQAVTAVYRIPPKKGSTRPSITFILSFRLHQLPKTIKAGFYSLKVRQYFPNPTRCYNCQRFGHTSTKCLNQAICPSCGQNKHPDSECSSTPICVNCSENHSPAYRGCRVYKHEFEIQKIKTTENIPYHEAKRKVKDRTPSLGQPFNVVTARKPLMVSQSTQCDLSPPPSVGDTASSHSQANPTIPFSQSLPPPLLSKSPPPSSSKTLPLSSSISQSSEISHSEKPKSNIVPKHHPITPLVTLVRTTSKLNKKPQPKITPLSEKKSSHNKDPPKKSRSNKFTPKSTPNSSRESILELTSPESMDLEIFLNDSKSK